MKTISIVIPCYNEQEVLPELFKRLTSVTNAWEYNVEMICINDGSKDNTWQLLKQQADKDSRWKIISFSRNFGHQTAVSCGLTYTVGDAVFIIDADLQDPPEVLESFLNKWEDGFDVVYAIRKARKESIFKKFSYWAFYRVLSKLSDLKIPLDSGDFSLMDRKVVNVINALPERNRFVRGLRAWAGFKQVGLEYERQARFAGETKYPFKKLLKLASDGIISFSSTPLIISAYIGMIVSFLAFIGVIFAILQRIFSPFFISIGIGPIAGYSTTIMAIMFLGGIQLIFLGIIGMYLGRIYDEVKQRPNWVIDESINL
ncbi:MAG: glycosyltransferase [bacterium]|nr:glycosyltransferase [bacterium]